MNRAEKVRKLLGDNVPADDFVIGHVISGAESYILRYCNIDSVPDGLENTLIDMAAEMCRESRDTSHKGIASLKEGDMSVSFSQNRTAGEICATFNSQLNRYRKLRW